MKRSCPPAASATRWSRHSCWNDPSRSIPSSASTLTNTRTACPSSGASTDPTDQTLRTLRPLGLWKVFVMGQVQRALDERDLAAFVGTLQREQWLLGDAYVVVPGRTPRNRKLSGGPRGIHRRPSWPRSRNPAVPAAAPVASHRARIRLREHAPHSITHPHLAVAGRSAACGRHGRTSRG